MVFFDTLMSKCHGITLFFDTYCGNTRRLSKNIWTLSQFLTLFLLFFIKYESKLYYFCYFVKDVDLMIYVVL